MRKERWPVIVFAIRFNDVELFRQRRKRGARVVTMEANFDELIVLVFVIVNVTVVVPLGGDILVRC